MKFKFLLILMLLVQMASAQKIELKARIARIASAAKGKVGVAFSVLEDNETYFVNGHGRMAMLSVGKLPVAMAVLHQVDQGKLSLSQKIHITKADLPETVSPLRLRYPEGDVDVSVADLLTYMVPQSDNNACDILVKQLGGLQQVQAYVRSLGLQDMEFKSTEIQMWDKWELQYTNWCAPVEVVKMLNLIYSGTVLTKTTNDLLWKLMLDGSTGNDLMKAMLPRSALVAHKIAIGPTNRWGLTAATNDAGVILLPSGKHLAVAVFITDGVVANKILNTVVAQITRIIYDDAITTDKLNVVKN
jgi:beta-lactamase class A